MAILSVKDFSVRFEDFTALSGVHFDLEHGEHLAVIGPNGSGKTVLIKALIGLITYSGTISWEAGATIGYVPQKIDADRHLPLTLPNLFESKARILRLAPGSIEKATTAVGLTDKALSTPVGHLSGGQFQKGLIAYALIGMPKVLVLDEPTASIDRTGEEQVYEMIHRLQDEFGMTVITVSHDLNFVSRYATKVLCLNQQQICFGEPGEAMASQNLEKLYGTGFSYYHHIHGDHLDRAHHS